MIAEYDNEEKPIRVYLDSIGINKNTFLIESIELSLQNISGTIFSKAVAFVLF